MAPRPPSSLVLRLAARYLRGRGRFFGFSLNTVIATGGVAIGVAALIVVLGVMNGLRDELRDRILVANPDLRVLTLGNHSGSSPGRARSIPSSPSPEWWPPPRKC